MTKAKPKRSKTPKRRRRDRPVIIGRPEDIIALLRTSENDWRLLAASAIRDFREIASLTDDQIRNTALRSVSKLERRLAVLSGQTEMFP